MGSELHGESAGSQMGWPCAIAVDIGGTFTDLVLVEAGGRLLVTKVPTVPEDPSQGVLDAVTHIAELNGLDPRNMLQNCTRFVHGSTVATNAVLERKLATVGLITTAGFRDGLEIRRGIRADQWDHRAPWPPVVVPRHRRFGVGGRIDHHGVELEPLNEDDVHTALDALANDSTGQVDSLAICLLHSYQNPAHELRVAELARQRWPGDRTVVSSELVPLLGEYTRTSTAVINAGLVPLVGGYLRRLAAKLAELGLDPTLLLMQSNGGTVPLDAVASRPVDLMLSGPAAVGGALRRSLVISTKSVSTTERSIVSMEIGGTSCDVAVMIDGSVAVIDGLEVGGYHVNIPSVDVHTIGAGGGTLARLDQAGMLVVGPQGAGAQPGPACYGRGGTLPTATDAHLLLGRLRPGRSAGGAIDLDEDLARSAVDLVLAKPLRMDVEQAAIGVIAILEQHLRQAVESITIERGRDPGRMTLVAAGGAGGLHGSPIARALGCQRLMIPAEAGVFCAVGMLHSNLRRDVSRSLVGRLEDLGSVGVLTALQGQQDRAAGLIEADWPKGIDTTTSWYVDMRYPGQLWSVRVESSSALNGDTVSVTELRTGFETEYQRLYGHTQPGGTLEVTAVGVAVEGHLPAMAPTMIDAATEPMSPIERRRCWLGPAAGSTRAAGGGGDEHRGRDQGWGDVPVYDGADLRAGHELSGPYLIEAATTTVLGLPGDRLTVRKNGDLEVELL